MKNLFFFILLLIPFGCRTQGKENLKIPTTNLVSGAERIQAYLPLIQGKKVGLIVNHTSTVGDTHLVDTLLSLNMDIQAIFAPEHGFRGEADAGEKVADQKDKKTNLPIISLYGKNKKPSSEQLKEIEILVFDIQDVGVRFYTYISTLIYVMEAAVENGIPLVILDRPNPNADQINGPVLKPKFKSFVGIAPIPIVYGLTIGEFAQMANGEKWLDKGKECNLKVIELQNYTHHDRYALPIKPSPNLPNEISIRLYPSLCLFEGTNISIGRGTNLQFQIIGGIEAQLGSYRFTPKDKPGAKNPPNEGKLCYGLNLSQKKPELVSFSLAHLLDFYKKTKNKTVFFTNEHFFNLLAGDDKLITQIKNGTTLNEIEKSWEKDLIEYKKTRSKYLIYPE